MKLGTKLATMFGLFVVAPYSCAQMGIFEKVGDRIADHAASAIENKTTAAVDGVVDSVQGKVGAVRDNLEVATRESRDDVLITTAIKSAARNTIVQPDPSTEPAIWEIVIKENYTTFTSDQTGEVKTLRCRFLRPAQMERVSSHDIDEARGTHTEVWACKDQPNVRITLNNMKGTSLNLEQSVF